MGAMIFGGLAVDCYFTLSEFEDFQKCLQYLILGGDAFCILNNESHKHSSGLLNLKSWSIMNRKRLILLGLAFLNLSISEFSPPIINCLI